MEGDAAGDIGFDDAGDHVGARGLGCDDHVDTGGARFLRDACDGGFDVGWGGLHEVGQLVHDDDDVGHPFGDVQRVLVARHSDGRGILVLVIEGAQGILHDVVGLIVTGIVFG